MKRWIRWLVEALVRVGFGCFDRYEDSIQPMRCGFGLSGAAFFLPVHTLQTSAVFMLQNEQLSDETE